VVSKLTWLYLPKQGDLAFYPPPPADDPPDIHQPHCPIIHRDLLRRTAERLLLGESKISTAGAKDVRVANLIAREMIYKCGFSKRLGPVALMGYNQGYLRGDGGEWVANLGSEVAAMAYADIVEVTPPPPTTTPPAPRRRDR